MTNPSETPTWRDIERWAKSGGPPPPTRVELTADEWRARLTPEQFQVMRLAGTERPHSSAMCSVFEPGRYHCAGCDTPLFDATHKFDSGTGWPSFWAAIPGAVATKVDYKLVYPRTEYHCRRCEGHQGHVFPDGPKPTGQRYCNNGVALKFVAA
jgi:peptide-methionine (R)-S-oxide reductase